MLRNEGLSLVQILAPVDWEGGSRGIAALPELRVELRYYSEFAFDSAIGAGKPMVHLLAGNLEPHHLRTECMAVFKENLAYAVFLFFFNGTAITVIYTLSLHVALPI